MESLSVNVRLRPVRIGFLVDPTDLSRVRAVMRLNACLWGGIFNPLIPVMGRIPPTWRAQHTGHSAATLTRGYLRFFEPDIFVETRPGQFEASGLRAEDEWRDRRRYRNWKTFLNEEEGASEFTVGVNTTDVYAHLFRTEFQYEKRHKPRILRFTESDPATTAFFEAAFGLFPKAKPLSYVPRFYKDALGAVDVNPTPTAWRAIIQERAGFPLYYTTRNLSVVSTGGSWDSVIFVFDPTSAADLIDFWNLRLFERNVVPVNVFWLEESRETLLKILARNHRPLPGNRNGVMCRTTIQIARSQDAEGIMRKLNLREHGASSESYVTKSWYDSIWLQPVEERSTRPSPLEVTAAERDVEVAVNPDRLGDVYCPQLNPEFDMRLGSVNSVNGPRWVNVLNMRTYGLHGVFAEALPSTVLSPSSSLNPRGIEGTLISREGLVHFHGFKRDSTRTSFPKRQDAIISWLKELGVDAEPSDPGRIADQIFTSIGGFDGARLLAEPEIIKMLDDMARRRILKRDGSSEEFLGPTANVQQWNKVFGLVRKRMPGLRLSLDRLVEMGMVRLGLSVKCSHCAKENWYGLDDVAESVRCERCLKTFAFPQGEPTPANPAWKYRVVGPFSTPHYAQGAYGVLLSLYFFHNRLGLSSRMTFSSNLNLKYRGKPLEVDFLLWHGSDPRGRQPTDVSVIVGEAKSHAGAAFKKEDTKRLRDLAGLFPGCYLVASTLKDQFSPEEIDRLTTLARWGWRPMRDGSPRARLILLTGKELFFHLTLEDAWRESGGRRAQVADRYNHIFSLVDLAVATQMIYLNFNEDELLALRYRTKRPVPAPPADPPQAEK